MDWCKCINWSCWFKSLLTIMQGIWFKIPYAILTLFGQLTMGISCKILLAQFNSIFNRRTIVCSNILLNSMGGGGDSILQWLFNSGWPLPYVGFTCVYMLLRTRLGSGMWAMIDFIFPFWKRGRLVQYIMHTVSLIFWIPRVSMFALLKLTAVLQYWEQHGLGFFSTL